MKADWQWTTGLRRVFRLPASPHRARRELDEELLFHLEGRVEELIEREQLSRPDAEREARRRFGDYESYRREAQHIDTTMRHRRNQMELVHTIRRECVHAFRSLRRARAFSTVAVITLALGLGATTTIFTLIDRVVLRPLPYPRSDRLMRLATEWPLLRSGMEYGISEFMYFRFKQTSRTLEDLGVYRETATPLPGDDGHDAEQAKVLLSSASLFGVLGVHPERGSLFTSEQELERNASVALISHDLWMRRYGGDPSIVGETVDFGLARMRVIGIFPASARLPDFAPDVWLPLNLNPGNPPRNAHTFVAIGLLRPGVTVDNAVAELSTITHQITVDHPNTYGDEFMRKTGFAFGGRSLRDDVVGPAVVRTLWLIFASVAFVLIIAAANVANLFLVRIDAQRREVAVRTALGASRAHLAVQYLCESGILAAASAAGAVGLAWLLLRGALTLAPSTLPRMNEVGLGWASIAFCIGVAASVGALFGILPLVRHGLDLGALRDGGRSFTPSRGRHAARRALVVSQVALAAVLLASAGLMLRSVKKLHDVQLGFDPRNVLTMGISLRPDRYVSDVQLLTFWSELYRRIAALPGVVAVGGAEILPLDGLGDGCTAIYAPESPLEKSLQMQCKPTITVTPGYFEAMRIPVNGHAPDWSDDARGAGSVVVSQSLANRFWPGESPIGKHLVYSVRRTLTFTVTGVAEDVRAQSVDKAPTEIAYFPATAPAAAGPSRVADMNANFQSVVVRTNEVDEARLGAEIKRIVAEIDPRVPVANLRPMGDVISASISRTSFTMTLMLLAALIALALSAAGIYGVVSYIVSQRRSEIGIRMALGAQARDVSSMVVGQSLQLAAAGIVIGVAAALASARLLQSMLFEVSTTDPIAIAASCLVLGFVTVAASFGPARRATRIDPVEAMRQ